MSRSSQHAQKAVDGETPGVNNLGSCTSTGKFIIVLRCGVTVKSVACAGVFLEETKTKNKTKQNMLR